MSTPSTLPEVETTNEVEAFYLLTSIRCYLCWFAGDFDSMDLVDTLRETLRADIPTGHAMPAWDRAAKWKFAYYAAKQLEAIGE